MARAWSLWPGLPIDLLYDISCRLHDAADYVRLHAVCKAWRDARPPPAPWLLARSDHGDRAVGFVFDAKPFHPRRHHRGILISGMTLVFSGNDGTACGGFDLPISAPAAVAFFPHYSDEIRSWVGGAVGRVSGDGTILLYAWVVPPKPHFPYTPQPNFYMALVRPGDAAWKFMPRYDENHTYGGKGARDQCCVAYHSGRIVLCKGTNWRIWSAQGEDDHRWHGRTHVPSNIFQSGYLLESRGELLWVSVWLNHEYFTHRDLMRTPPSVSVYSLQEQAAQRPWVKRDSRSLADRVLFLGHPISFAVDASRVGMIRGRAYFILHRRKQCPELIEYRLDDGSVKVVQKLPEDFRGKACTWLTPKPVVAS